MKKLLLVVALIALVATASNAQFKYGGGITYGNDMDLGLNIRGDYAFSENLSVAPGFSYFFPGNDITYWQLNADAHYSFTELSDGVKLYGIGGLNYSHFKFDLAFDLGDFGSVGADVSESEIGLNLGAGITYNQFYGELKYDTAFAGQLALSVGILFGGN